MKTVLRTTRTCLTLLAAVITAAALSPSAFADSGTVHLTISKAGFIVGVGGGSGTLTFHGRSYPLSIGGVSVGTIGAARAQLVGHVRNIRNPEDIAGTYSAITASVAVAGGGKVATLQNAKGVILELRGKQVGFELSAALSGLEISLR